MNFFKRLCSQNQERKFNIMWQKLNELTAKHSEVSSGTSSTDQSHVPFPLCPLSTDAPTTRRRSGRTMKTFSEWIEHKPREKWSLLYDTNGARYGIMTTKLAEVYNWVLRVFRCLPLVAIVEGIVHNTCKYFIERYARAADSMADARLVYSAKLTTYMEDKISKASFHSVRRMGTVQHRYEVLCKERFRRGVNRQPIVQECQIMTDGVCHCSCMKPLLLHRPCSHVIAACSLMNMAPSSFVSPYYLKQSVMST